MCHAWPHTARSAPSWHMCHAWLYTARSAPSWRMCHAWQRPARSAPLPGACATCGCTPHAPPPGLLHVPRVASLRPLLLLLRVPRVAARRTLRVLTLTLTLILHTPTPSPHTCGNQMRNAAFLLAAHGHCRKDTYFRLWIKDTAGEGDDVGQLVAHKPEWLLRDCGKVYVEEEDDVQDQQDQAELDPDNDGVEQACSYRCPMATHGHVWHLRITSPRVAGRSGLECLGSNCRPDLCECK